MGAEVIVARQSPGMEARPCGNVDVNGVTA